MQYINLTSTVPELRSSLFSSANFHQTHIPLWVISASPSYGNIWVGLPLGSGGGIFYTTRYIGFINILAHTFWEKPIVWKS